MRVASPLTLQPEERRELERWSHGKSPHQVLWTAKADDILRKVARLGLPENKLRSVRNTPLAKHGDKVFLNRDELMKYTSQQSSRTTSKKMLVLVLSKPRKYAKGIRYRKPITLTGEYLTEENYNTLFQETRKYGDQTI